MINPHLFVGVNAEISGQAPERQRFITPPVAKINDSMLKYYMIFAEKDTLSYVVVQSSAPWPFAMKDTTDYMWIATVVDFNYERADRQIKTFTETDYTRADSALKVELEIHFRLCNQTLSLSDIGTRP